MSNTFKIHSICLTKNEADVVEHCLSDAVKWSDYIYVYDGGSTDGTWEIVCQLAAINPRIIAWKQDDKVFQESLRGEVFAEFRHLASDGDWWLQLNVDEFYPLDYPPSFLAQVPRNKHVVVGLPIEYLITDVDLEYTDLSGTTREVLPRLHYYRCNYCEIRAFRYRSRMKWGNAAWPYHLGPVFKDLIKFKHYPYRSPSQIQMRLDIRRANRARGFAGWDHAKEESWKQKIVSASTCFYDRGNGKYDIDRSSMPRHIPSLRRRIVQTIAHSLRIWP